MSDPPLGERVTLARVAAQAGVSRATASRALRGDSRISAPTSVAVREAALTLGYVPNLAARSLRAKETHALGLVLADLRDPVHAMVAAGFELEAAKADYTVIIVAAGGELDGERRALRAFIERGTDGICIASGVIEPHEARDRLGGVPLVLLQPDHASQVTRSAGEEEVGVIRADDAAGVRAAVWHLRELGRRDIAYLGSGDRATNRLRGAAAADAMRGLNAGTLRSFQVADDAWTRPREVADALIGALPDAVICYDDKTALALLDGLRGSGIDVPGRVAVVGFDDIPFAALSNPRLTTVSTPVVEMGELAARSLVEATGSRALPPGRVLPVELVVRESTAGYARPRPLPADRGRRTEVLARG
jgi:LacI family transcriptional regulator